MNARHVNKTSQSEFLIRGIRGAKVHVQTLEQRGAHLFVASGQPAREGAVGWLEE
jgi:hypothetical protein